MGIETRNDLHDLIHNDSPIYGIYRQRRERGKTAPFLHHTPTVDPPCSSLVSVVDTNVVLFDEIINRGMSNLLKLM